MPPEAEPSTMLSRVVPHDACLATLASVMPYLSKIFFSLATISGAASVSAMKPRVTLLVSGPVACAKAPDGNDARTVPISAAVAVAPFRTSRRPKLVFLLAICPLLNGSPQGLSVVDWQHGRLAMAARRQAVAVGAVDAHLARGGAIEIGAVDAIGGGLDVDVSWRLLPAHHLRQEPVGVAAPREVGRILL